MRAPIVRASTSVATLATWWSPNAMCSSTVCARRVRVRVVGHVPGVAVRLAAIPERLDQRQQQRPDQLVRVGRIEHRRERVEVDRAREQQAVVHRRHDQHRAREVGRHRGQRAAGDARPGCRPSSRAGACRSAGPLASQNARLAAKPFGWIIARPRKRKLSMPCWSRSASSGKSRQVLQDRDRVGHVAARHADPVGRAQHHPVLAGDREAADAVHLARAAEQAVAVERHPARRGRA